MNKVLDFLTDLATNPQQQFAFANAPEATLGQAGLTEMEKQLLQSADKDRISTAFIGEFNILAVACVDPVEDPLPDPDPPSDPDSSEQ